MPMVEAPRTVGYILAVLAQTRYAPDQTTQARGAWQLQITDAAVQRYSMTVHAESIAIDEGAARDPMGSIAIDAEAFVRLCYNEVQPATLLRKGRLQAEGDLERLLTLLALISGFDGAAARLNAIDEGFRARPPVTAIERVEDPTLEQVRAAGTARLPLVIPRAVRDWKALSWTLESLTARYGEVPLRGAELAAQPIQLKDLLAGIGAATDRDGIKSGSARLPDELLADLGTPPLFPQRYASPRPGDDKPFVETFFSAARTTTDLHRDLPDGLVTVFLGKRRFTLFSPDQASLVYAAAGVRGDFQSCDVTDPSNIDYERYPRAREARSIDVVLEPGDLLYLPGGWFHHVTALEHSICVKFHLAESWATEPS